MTRDYTTNLNLVLPKADDQYSIRDFNDNAKKIDDFAGLTPSRALTADKLTNGSKIDGVLFNGSEDIELPIKGAKTDLSNLTEVGEKHFLNKQQITNCILEIPQRIKYTLENGTLTIKAGSVVIVPYGVEDLTSQYPKGATFINDNFKVYDTQYADGKFFVWAEIQNDKTLSLLNRDTVDFVFYTFSDDRLAFSTYSNSGDAQPSAVTLWYNTLNNNVNKTSTTAIELTDCTLPLMIINNKTDITQGSIDKVFNGFGYIGSIIWVDKDVKGLIPNSRKEDGTLNNIERTVSNIIIRTLTTQNGDIHVGSNLANAIELYGVTGFVQDEVNNINTNNQIIIANITATNGVISNFQPKQPVNLATKDMVDGQIVAKYLQLSEAKNVGEYTLDLSNYLPDNKYDYEVLIQMLVNSTYTTFNSTGYVCQARIQTPFYGSVDVIYCSCGVSDSKTFNSYHHSTASLIIPKNNQTINLKIIGSNAQYCYVRAYSYRRIGVSI